MPNETRRDRVVLLENGQESLGIRLDLIDNAEERIDITYHSIQDGVAASLFFTSLLEAACRGVQVRVILDGMFHHVRGALKIVSSLGSSRQIAKEMNVTYHLEKVEVSTKNRH